MRRPRVETAPMRALAATILLLLAIATVSVTPAAASPSVKQSPPSARRPDAVDAVNSATPLVASLRRNGARLAAGAASIKRPADADAAADVPDFAAHTLRHTHNPNSVPRSGIETADDSAADPSATEERRDADDGDGRGRSPSPEYVATERGTFPSPASRHPSRSAPPAQARPSTAITYQVTSCHLIPGQ
jgi:hypothetical protein